MVGPRSGPLGYVHISLQEVFGVGAMTDRSEMELLPRGATLAPAVTLYPAGVKYSGMSWDRTEPPPAAERGPCSGFSVASRRRLRMKLMSVDWSRTDSYFVSLTYHKTWPGDWRQWKKQLQAFTRRLQRAFPDHLGIIWRLEFQKRGAPHFHLVVLWSRGSAPARHDFSRWCRGNWLAVIGGTKDRAAWAHGVVTLKVNKKRGYGAVVGYLLKEMGKLKQSVRVDTETGEVQSMDEIGRVWGLMGSVPLIEGPEIEFTAAEARALMLAVHEDARGSWLWENVSIMWPGYTLIADPKRYLRVLRRVLPSGDPRLGLVDDWVARCSELEVA